MFDIVLLEIALFGEFYVSNNGFVSVGRTAAVLSRYSYKHDTGSIIMSSKFGGMLTSKPLRDISFLIPKKKIVNELSTIK